MWFYMVQKTDLGVKMFFKDGRFNGANADVLKGHLKSQKIKLYNFGKS